MLNGYYDNRQAWHFMTHHLIRSLTASMSAFHVLSARRGRIFHAATISRLSTNVKREKDMTKIFQPIEKRPLPMHKSSNATLSKHCPSSTHCYASWRLHVPMTSNRLIKSLRGHLYIIRICGEISLFKVYTLRCLLRCQSTVQAVRTVTQADDFTYRRLVPIDQEPERALVYIASVYVGRRGGGWGSRASRESERP